VIRYMAKDERRIVLKAKGRTISVAVKSALYASLPLPVFAGQAQAAIITPESTSMLGSVGMLILAGGLFAALYKLRKSKQAEINARHRLGELEHFLNEAEAAIHSEAQLMLTWRGRDETPDRLVGTMHGVVQVPNSLIDVMNYQGWLEPDSATMLIDGLKTLRQSGNPFNLAIKTKLGDLLEADGRAAGGLAILRFRPLAGERRQLSENQYDALKLAKQVERLSAVLDAAPFPIWIKNPEGQLSWINQAYIKATDQTDSENILKANINLIKFENIDSSKANQSTNLLGRAHAVQLGSMHAFNVHEIDMSIGRAGFAVDVTPQEAAEKELDRHIKAHASTLDKLNTAIAIFGADQRIRFYNQAYVALWNLDDNWLQTGPSDGEILDKLRTLRSLPEESNYREWRSKQLAAYTNLELHETYWYLPDGRSLRVICEQHPFGGVTYLYENLTKEYQLESRYNELFQVQRETLDNLAEAVALSGSDGRVKLYNPAFSKFWSLQPSFLEQKPHVEQLSQLETLSADSRAGWQEIKYGVTGIEANRKAHEGRMSQDGRILRYRAVPLPDGNALLTFTDVSDTVRAEQALRERAEALEATDRLKNNIIANVSYEVRTPLTSIVGFAEALEQGFVGALSPKQKDYVSNIRRSSEDLQAIIDTIIDLSAIDAGQMELKREDVDIADLLQNTAQKFAGVLNKRELDLSIEITEDITTLNGDKARLEQILSHLLSNAAGFSKQGSKIRMGARLNKGMVQIWVADHGRGIEPEFQSKVFDRFQSMPVSGGHRGPGLGLSIVKSLTELHGGKVSLVSKLNQGTTVICTLPLAAPPKNDVISRSALSATFAA
jgi:signal transduction histidine kinase